MVKGFGLRGVQSEISVQKPLFIAFLPQIFWVSTFLVLEKEVKKCSPPPFLGENFLVSADLQELENKLAGSKA